MYRLILWEWKFVLPVVQYLLYGRIVVQAVEIGPPAGLYQPFGAYMSGKAQDAPTRYVSLLRIRLVPQYFGYVICHVLVHGRSLKDELLWIPVRRTAVMRGPVLVYRGIFKTGIGTLMRGYTGIVAVYVQV